MGIRAGDGTPGSRGWTKEVVTKTDVPITGLPLQLLQFLEYLEYEGLGEFDCRESELVTAAEEWAKKMSGLPSGVKKR